MSSILSKLRLFIAGACLIPNISFGGSVSGGGGDTLPPNPIGSKRIVLMLPALRGPILSYFWALQTYESHRSDKSYSVFFDGPVTVYNVIDSLKIDVLTDDPCLDGSGKEVDGSSYANSSTGICISAYRLGYKLDSINAFAQTMGLVIHELSHKFGFDEEAATRLQTNVVMQVSSESLGDFKNRWRLSYSKLVDILDALNSVSASSDWNIICSKAQELKRQHDEFQYLMYQSAWTSVIRWSRGNQIIDDSWTALGIGIAGCGRADSPLRTERDEANFKRYLKAFGSANVLSISDFTKNYGEEKERWNSSQEMLKIDSISAAAQESKNLLERQAGLFDDLEKLQKDFNVTPIGRN